MNGTLHPHGNKTFIKKCLGGIGTDNGHCSEVYLSLLLIATEYHSPPANVITTGA